VNMVILSFSFFFLSGVSEIKLIKVVLLVVVFLII
jgi:hypothetical protein